MAGGLPTPNNEEPPIGSRAVHGAAFLEELELTLPRR